MESLNRSAEWLPAGDELDAVVRSGCRLVGQGVEDADGVCGGHALTDLVRGEPLDALRFVGGGGLAGDRVAAVDEGDDVSLQVLVGAGEPVDFDGHAGFFGYFAADAFFEGLAQFEDSAGGFPVSVVAALDREDSAVAADDDARDADGVSACVVRRPFGVA